MIYTGPPQIVKRIDIPLQHWFYCSHIRDHREIEAHDHNYLEFVFILSGSAHHVTISGSNPCQAGDLFIIPIGSWHSYSHCHQLELVNCLFSPTMLTNELAWVTQDPVLRNYFGTEVPLTGKHVHHLHLAPKSLKITRDLLLQIQLLSNQKDAKLELIGNLMFLFAAIRNLAQQVSTPKPIASSLHPSIKRAMEMLNGNLAHDWSLSVLAQQLRINPSYLVRLFQTQAGIPPMKYLNKIRAETAATLLVSRDMHISEIGQQVGWTDPKQFARQFKNHFKQSATQYRTNILQS